MERMNTADHKTEPLLSEQDVRTLFEILEDDERREINAPEPLNRRSNVFFEIEEEIRNLTGKRDRIVEAPAFILTVIL